MPNIHKLYGHVRFKSKMYVLFTNPFHNHSLHLYAYESSQFILRMSFLPIFLSEALYR